MDETTKGIIKILSQKKPKTEIANELCVYPINSLENFLFSEATNNENPIIIEAIGKIANKRLDEANLLTKEFDQYYDKEEIGQFNAETKLDFLEKGNAEIIKIIQKINVVLKDVNIQTKDGKISTIDKEGNIVFRAKKEHNKISEKCKLFCEFWEDYAANDIEIKLCLLKIVKFLGENSRKKTVERRYFRELLIKLEN